MNVILFQTFITGESKHWLCTCNHGSGVVQVMDSLGLFISLNEFTILQITKIYSAPPKIPTLEIQTLSIQQQQGNYDCGLFSIANAMEVCLGNNPENVLYDQKQMRSHLYECFQRGVLTQFPKMSQEQEALPRPMRMLQKKKLFCYCMMPEEYDEMMIACDLCKRWYHCSCVKVDTNEIPRFWKCCICIF